MSRRVTPNGRGLGWKRQLPDHRDHIYSAPKVADLPPKVDMRPQCPKEVYDQGQLGSCTANAIAGALEFLQIKQGFRSVFTPSRLFVYWQERNMEGTVNEDAGAEIRDGIKAVNQFGAPPEEDWPYEIPKFKDRPSDKAYADAMLNQALQYAAVTQTPDQIKGALASGYPVVFGFTVYASFESAVVERTGVVPMPSPNEGVLGGHAVLAVGYDDSQARYIVRNSWGSSWADGGYFYFPYDYMHNPNLCDDFWHIDLIESQDPPAPPPPPPEPTPTPTPAPGPYEPGLPRFHYLSKNKWKNTQSVLTDLGKDLKPRDLGKFSPKEDK